jgi:hypothetical protein
MNLVARVVWCWRVAKASEFQTFLKQEGDKTVPSPLTGKDIKLRSLSVGQYRENDQAQKILQDEYERWKGSDVPDVGFEDEDEDEDEGVEERDLSQVEAPSPDMGDGQRLTTKDVDNAFKLVWEGLQGKRQLSDGEIQKLRDTEKELRELAGEDEDDDRRGGKDGEIRTTTVSEEARKLVEDYQLKPRDLERFRDYAVREIEIVDEIEEAKASIRAKHNLTTTDEEALTRNLARLRKHMQDAEVQHKEDLDRWIERREDRKVKQKEYDQIYPDLVQDFEKVGAPPEMLDNLTEFRDAKVAEYEDALRKWESNPKKKPADKPRMPESLHYDWLKHHRATWPKDKQYTNPPISTDLFDKAVKTLPVLGTLPDKPKPPPKMTHKRIHEYLRDQDEALAEKVKGMSEADLEALVTEVE